MSTESISLNPAIYATPLARVVVVQPSLLPKSANEAAAEPVAVDEGAPLSDAVDTLNRYVAGSRTDLKFAVDHDAGQLVVSIIDSESGQVLRQMPSVEALRIARYLEHDRLGLIRQSA